MVDILQDHQLLGLIVHHAVGYVHRADTHLGVSLEVGDLFDLSTDVLLDRRWLPVLAQAVTLVVFHPLLPALLVQIDGNRSG